MSNDFLFTSESVFEGHPDKVADQISDAIINAIFEKDPKSCVAAETLTNASLVVLACEITTNAHCYMTTLTCILGSSFKCLTCCAPSTSRQRLMVTLAVENPTSLGNAQTWTQHCVRRLARSNCEILLVSLEIRQKNSRPIVMFAKSNNGG
jgi:hypothetical protein